MTIEITDEMVRETIKRAVQKWNESVGPDEHTLTPSDIFSEDVRDHLTAALPIIEKQMRAAWEAELLGEGVLGAGYSVLMNPKAGEHPVATFTRAVRHMLALLEGGRK